jgi:hypothetical protein
VKVAEELIIVIAIVKALMHPIKPSMFGSAPVVVAWLVRV